MLKAGQRLGEFEIIRLLGKGGMGEVYEAQQFNPFRRVALKVLAPWLADYPECLERFWREAEVPAQLDHPGIVRIISTGQTPEGMAYFAMQLVRGISLAELLRRAKDPPQPSTTTSATPAPFLASDETPTKGLLPLPSGSTPPGDLPRELLREFQSDRFGFIARYGSQAARALAFAHSQGVLHRDIKPSNLMIDQHRQVYIVDFGLTRGFGPNAMGSQVGPVRGTPWYMSPEQARGQEIDQRSDIYSLGVTFYELATLGVGPFTASRDSVDAVLSQVRAGQYLPLRVLVPELPRPLEAIILKAMQFRPQKRHASAAELAAELENFAEIPSRVSSRAHRVQGKRLRPLLPLASVLGVCALLAGLGLTVAYSLRFWGSPAPTSPVGSQTDQLDQDSSEGRAVHPEHLRTAAVGIPLPLLNTQAEPAYGRILNGDGRYSTTNGVLSLIAPSRQNPTVLALAHDPESQHYQFSCELGFGKQLPPMGSRSRLGVFLGWRQNNARDVNRQRCLWLSLAPGSAPEQPGGVVRLGTTLVIPRSERRGAELQWGCALVRGLGVLPLYHSNELHRVRIRVGGKQVRLQVDDLPPAEFDMQSLLEEDRLISGEFSPTGFHGVWAEEGIGFFRNIIFERLPPPG